VSNEADEPAFPAGRPIAPALHSGRVRCRDKVLKTFHKRKVHHLRAVDTVLNAAEFQAAIDKLGIRRTEVGPWLGLHKRQGERMSSGERDVSLLITKLLTLMVRLGIKPEQV
jgi:hypothetical protein